MSPRISGRVEMTQLLNQHALGVCEARISGRVEMLGRNVGACHRLEER